MRSTLLACLTVAAATAPLLGQDTQISDAKLAALMKSWEKDVRARLAGNERLAALAAKHKLALLHSRHRYVDPDEGQRYSAYNFAFGSNDPSRRPHLIFDNGSGDLDRHYLNTGAGSVLAWLGKFDFEKEVDPAKITVDHPGLGPTMAEPVEGHVYLQRVRDKLDNDFFVLLQVVAVDKDERYVAFLWRKLLGGKHSTRERISDPEPRRQPRRLDDKHKELRVQDWEKAVRDGLKKNEKTRALLQKNSLVLLKNRGLPPPLDQSSTFCFIHETSNEKVHQGVGNLNFSSVDNDRPELRATTLDSVLVRLGQVDFAADPDPKAISVQHPGLETIFSNNHPALEQEVYLQRVRHPNGTDFFVVFQVVAVDPDARYMAFLWRMLPGGKRIVPPAGPANVN